MIDHLVTAVAIVVIVGLGQWWLWFLRRPRR